MRSDWEKDQLAKWVLVGIAKEAIRNGWKSMPVCIYREMGFEESSRKVNERDRERKSRSGGNSV